MDEKVLKGITVLMAVLTLGVSVSMYFFPDMHERAVLAAEAKAKLMEENQMTLVSANEKPEEIVQETESVNGQLQIQLPEGISQSEIQIENNYLTQTVFIHVDTDVEDYFSSYRIAGKCDHIASLSYYKDKESGVIALALDRLYEIEPEYDEGNLYLDFVDPHEIYDKVLVVDAGHGSRAAGAVKLNVEEKNIDLQIVLALKEIIEESGEKIGVYYTRLEDSNPTFEQRVGLANKANADLFISIHNNANDNGYFSSLDGTQVLYSQSSKGEFNSRRLARLLLDEVCSSTGSRKIGLLGADDIYIIRNSEVPVALVEIGFMTNREELEKLQDPEYQKKAAQGIFNGVMKAFEAGY